ncbi:MAG: hypothetical protein L3J23_02100 [Flavobacteriaceae bacterium]|nr:hypothetical protein [Flavobacteriaceae bacterium]
MTIKLKVTLLKMLLVLISILFASCIKKSNSKITLNKQEKVKFNTKKIDSYVKIKDTILVKKSVLNFLTLQQNLLSNNKIKNLSNHVSFPLDGDAVYFMIYGDDFLKSPQKFFKQKINKKNFIKKNELIFIDIYKYLFCNIDFHQELFDSEYHYMKKDKKGVLWDLDVSINFENNSFTIYMSKITENSEEEYSIFYQYNLIRDKYLLFYIGTVG